MKFEFTLSVTVRGETRAILERLTELAAKKKGGHVAVEETARTVLEVGIRALAEEAKKTPCDPDSKAMIESLLGA